MSGSITSLESLSQSQGSDAGESATAIFETQSHEETYSFDEIKRELLDPHAISKKYDQAGRDSTASALHDTRRRSSDTSAEISTGNVRRGELATQLSDVIGSERQLEVAVADRMSAVVVRLKSVLGLSDKRVGALQETLVATQANAESLGQELDQIEATLEALRKEQETLPDTATLVEAYYSKMEVQPLTNEEKRRFLTPEFLSSLSMDEYVALWRRLNPYFLSHVTRQGFRDHNAMVYHSGGLQEFHNGFVGVMEDERLLRPPFALHGLRGRDKESVEQWMESWILQAEDADIAKQRLDALLHFSLASAPSYPDKTAVHFAAQVVANSYYGGETYNEVFFIYPSDALASQHDFAFNGWEKDFTKPQSEMKWNDVFMWPSSIENPGIPIDAGVVFLPSSTLVDRNTGSKYASETVTDGGKAKRVMVEDTALVDSFVRWGAILNDKESAVVKTFAEYKDAPYWMKERLERTVVETFSGEFQALGFSEDAAWALGNRLLSEMHYQQEFSEEVLLHAINESGAQWARAKDVITSKDYWESLFAVNPHMRPKHVVYYEGSPTGAVLEFQQRNGIGSADTSATEGALLGFDDRHINLNEQMGVGDPALNQNIRAMRGHDELIATASSIIDERYKAKE